MSRTLPVLYSTLALYEGIGTQRELSETAPSSESTSTTVPSGLSAQRYYLIPETAASTDNGGYGWMLDPLQFLFQDEIMFFPAGDWTVVVHYSRPGGLLTGNVSGTLQVQMISLDDNGFVLQATENENITITTSEQSRSFVISCPAFSLKTKINGRLQFKLRFDRNSALASDTSRFHTNSSSAFRVTAAPAYDAISPARAVATGAASVSGVGAKLQLARGEASGSATAVVQGAQTQATKGESSGIATVDGRHALVLPSRGITNGAASVSGAGAQTHGFLAEAAGASTVDGSAAQTHGLTAEADGAAAVEGRGATVKGGIGEADGAGTALAQFGKIQGMVGEADICPEGGGGGDTIIRRPVYVFGD